MKLGLLKQLGELDPMADLVEPPGLVVRMAPETGGLVTTAYKQYISNYMSSV